MALGDILSVTILDSENPSQLEGGGWKADVVIEGFKDGGTYDFGMGVDNDPSDAKIVFTVISEGYDNTGSLGTISRTLYGTKALRLPYPNETDLDETEADGNLTVTISLSDFIYNDDRDDGIGTSGTDPIVSISNGWYIDNGDGGSSNLNNETTNLTVINNSTLEYPKVIGNWAWPGFEIASEDHIIECVAFHKFSQNGQPVAVVKFDAKDESLNSASTQIVTNMTISDRDDPNAVLVYKATIPVTSLTQGEVITVDFKAYPWLGDENSVLDTRDGVNVAPSPLYTSTTFLCNKNNTFGQTVAFVDSSSGDDGTGIADDITNSSTSQASPYLTISGAINGIVAYNNSNHSRNNAEAGIVYLEEGNHLWTGGVNTPGTIEKTWLTITKAPNSIISNVIINGESGDEDAGDRVKINSISISANVVILFNNIEQLWINNCNINDSSTAFNYSSDPSFAYYTHNTITTIGELRPFSTRNTSLNLIRGNIDNDSTTISTVSYTILGNTGYIGLSNGYGGQTIPQLNNIIYAFNNTKVDEGRLCNVFHVIEATGLAFVQNIIERTTNDAQPLVQIAGDQSTVDANNIIFWYNTTIGQRCNLAYNDSGSFPHYRYNWSIKNNLLSEYNIKTDIFISGDGNRIGNWSNIYGVNYCYNWFRGETINHSEFDGFFVENGIDSTPDDAYFVDDRSVDGTDLGGGDYHLTYLSTNAIGRSQEVLLPYDIEGNIRFIDSETNGGAVGAYEYGTPPNGDSPDEDTSSNASAKNNFQDGYFNVGAGRISASLHPDNRNDNALIPNISF